MGEPEDAVVRLEVSTEVRGIVSGDSLFQSYVERGEWTTDGERRATVGRHMKRTGDGSTLANLGRGPAYKWPVKESSYLLEPMGT